MRTIYCDEFREIFKIDKPCCAECHEEYEDENIPYYESVIGESFVILTLPDGENVMAHLCCSMLHTNIITRMGK